MKKIVVIILLFVGSLLVFNLINAYEYKNVNATYDYENIDYSEYTSSNKFSYQENNETKKDDITNYSRHFWKNNINIKNTNVTILGDDPIVDIIPKDFFIFRGEYFHIGKEYAFYVKTSRMSDYSNYVRIYLIDIINDYDNINITSHKIKPIFQADFWYLTDQDNFSNNFSNKMKLVSNSKAVVVPALDFDYGSYVMRILEQKSDLLIKNMGIEIGLQNEQHINQSDLDYVGINNDKTVIDKGSFITRTDINYLGYSEKDYSDLINFVISLGVDILGLGADIFSPKPKIAITTALMAISLIGGAILTLKDLVGIMQESKHGFRTTVKTTDSAAFGENHDYTTAFDQLDKKGILNKGTIVSTFGKEKVGGSLLLGNQRNIENASNTDYFEASFTLSESQNWLTRVTTAITMSIADKNGKELVTKQTQFYNSIRSEEHKNLDFNTLTEGYTLNYGKDFFKFSPQFSSNYLINVSNNNLSLNIYNINDVNKTNLFNNGIVSLEKNQEYIFEITNDTSNRITFNIEVNVQSVSINNTNSINHNFNKGLYKVTFTKKELITFNLSQGNFKIYNKDLNLITETITQELYYKLMDIDSFYYIYVEGDGKLELLNDYDNITLNNQNILDTTKFYKFMVPADSTYRVNVFFEKKDEHVNFMILTNKNDQFTIMSHISQPKLSTYLKDLTQNTIIYIGAISNAVFEINFEITTYEKTIAWTVDGTLITNNELRVKQGDVVKVEVTWSKIPLGKIVDLTSPYNDVVFSNNILKIEEYAVITKTGNWGNGNSLKITDWTGLTVTLIIIIEPVISLSYVYDIYDNLNFTIFIDTINSAAILTIKFVLYSVNESGIVDKNVNFDIAFKNSKSYKYSINLDGNNQFISHSKENPNNKWYLKLEFFKYENENENNDGDYANIMTFINFKDVRVHSLFASGDGSSYNPYLIANEDHLNNIRLVSRKAHFELFNNVTMKTSTDWETISGDFSGSLDGKYYSIINFKSTTQGFFQQLVNAKIKNITFKNPSINTNLHEIDLGIISGRAFEYSTVENCEIIDVNIRAPYAKSLGGLIGWADKSALSNIKVIGKIQGTNKIGGILGTASGRAGVSNIFVSVEIKIISDILTKSVFVNENDNPKVGGVFGVLTDTGGISKINHLGVSINFFSDNDKNPSTYFEDLTFLHVGYRIHLFKPIIGIIVGENTNGSVNINDDHKNIWFTPNYRWLMDHSSYSHDTYIHNEYIGKNNTIGNEKNLFSNSKLMYQRNHEATITDKDATKNDFDSIHNIYDKIGFSYETLKRMKYDTLVITIYFDVLSTANNGIVYIYGHETDTQYWNTKTHTASSTGTKQITLEVPIEAISGKDNGSLSIRFSGRNLAGMNDIWKNSNLYIYFDQIYSTSKY